MRAREFFLLLSLGSLALSACQNSSTQVSTHTLEIQTCINPSTSTAEGRWITTDTIPEMWRHESEIEGQFTTIDDTSASFVGPDGFVLRYEFAPGFNALECVIG